MKIEVNPHPECQPLTDDGTIEGIKHQFEPAPSVEGCAVNCVCIPTGKAIRERTVEFENYVLFHTFSPTVSHICPVYVRFKARLTKYRTPGTCFPNFVLGIRPTFSTTGERE